MPSRVQNRSPEAEARRRAKQAAKLRERYRTDPEWRAARLKKRSEEKRSPVGLCEICGTGPVTLHRDHNHETGARRGNLCPHCNWLLGHSKERKEVLLAAIAYLEKYA